jgi:hypothetical protein
MPQPSREAGAALLFTISKTDVMKNIYTALALLLPFWAAGQTKFDNTWIFGYAYSDTTTDGTIVRFDKGYPEYTAFKIPWAVTNANAAISDTKGKLMFYSNGCKIMNSQHKIMKNGNGINQGGYFYEQWFVKNLSSWQRT